VPGLRLGPSRRVRQGDEVSGLGALCSARAARDLRGESSLTLTLSLTLSLTLIPTLTLTLQATLRVALCLALEQRRRVRVFLTALGGGAFGNRHEWIADAICGALERMKVHIHLYRCYESKDKPYRADLYTSLPVL